jgi:hypothetical protein
MVFGVPLSLLIALVVSRFASPSTTAVISVLTSFSCIAYLLMGDPETRAGRWNYLPYIAASAALMLALWVWRNSRNKRGNAASLAETFR